MFLCGTGALGGIDGFDIITFSQGALVGSETSLSEFINALVGTGSARLDHIKNTTLVGGKTSNFPDNTTNQGGAFA